MKVKIRHAETRDSKDIHELYTQPEVIAGTLQLPFPSEQTWKQRIESQNENMYILVAEVEGKVISSLGLWHETNLRRRHVAHIAMAVHDDWQNKGVGSEILKSALELADNWLNIIRIELSAFVDNEPAIKLYQKFGFVSEGILKSYAFKSGEFCDVVSMARIK